MYILRTFVEHGLAGLGWADMGREVYFRSVYEVLLSVVVRSEVEGFCFCVVYYTP